MASVGFMIGGALVNALAFSGSNYLFKSMDKKRVDEERKRHDLAVEKLQKDKEIWVRERSARIDFLNNEIRKKNMASARINDLDGAMREYYQLFGHEDVGVLRPKPELSDYYVPSDDQKDRELTFLAGGLICIGGVLFYFYN